MQQLHLVGFTTDLEGLIFSARRGSRSGGYMVVLDERLVARIEEALRLREARAEEGAPGEAAAPAVDEGGARRRLFPEEEELADSEGEPEADDDGHVEDADFEETIERRPVGPRLRQARTEGPRRESALTPREMQARLRAGYSIGQVAREAGVGEEWVARFAAPIIAEQQQVLDRARGLVFTAPRKGQSSLPLGASVEWAVAERGVAIPSAQFEEAWSAYQLRDGSWVVRFSYTSRRREQHADWQVNLRSGELTALNRLATDLGYAGKAPRTRFPTVEPAIEADVAPPTRPRPARRRAAPGAPRPAPSRAALAKEVAAKKTAAPRPPKRVERVAEEAETAVPAPKARTKASRAPKRAAAKKPAAQRPVVQKPAEAEGPVREKSPAAKKGSTVRKGRAAAPEPAAPPVERQASERVAAAGKVTGRRALAAAVKSSPGEAGPEVDWSRPPVVRRRPRANKQVPPAETQPRTASRDRAEKQEPPAEEQPRTATRDRGAKQAPATKKQPTTPSRSARPASADEPSPVEERKNQPPASPPETAPPAPPPARAASRHRPASQPVPDAEPLPAAEATPPAPPAPPPQRSVVIRASRAADEVPPPAEEPPAPPADQPPARPRRPRPLRAR